MFIGGHGFNILIYRYFFSFFLSGFSFTNIHNLQDSRGKWGAIYLSPLYYFHPLHKHLGIRRATAAEISPLHIASSRTRTRNLWFPSASLQPLSYSPLDIFQRNHGMHSPYSLQFNRGRGWGRGKNFRKVFSSGEREESEIFILIEGA